MHKKDLIKSLEDYKRKESIIETTLARVSAYEKALENPESFTAIHMGSSSELGMPKGKGGKPSSPVEKIVQNCEADREEIIETLKIWIKEDLSKIRPLQIELEQIDGALNALTKEQRCIIDCKYFEKMIWSNVELNFNKQFNKNINSRQIQNINEKALKELGEVLSTYYKRKIV